MTDFRVLTLPVAETFEALLASAPFEELGPGRRGTVLVAPDGDRIPLVRTTTAYAAPACRFAAIHTRLADAIAPGFNNALIEHYTSAYSTMKRHTDQMLDLADDSSIAIYSAYRDPARPSRRLIVKPKDGGAGFELPLEHGGVVVFSLAANRRHTHTIARRPNTDTDWLGVTFRTAKTFVRFVDDRPMIEGAPLSLATEDQRRDLYALKRRENDEVDFTYPAISYTLSPSDLLPV